MRTRREMFHIAVTISLVIMLTISPIVLGKAYSVEYTGQTFNTGNNVQSKYISLELYTADSDGNYSKTNGNALNTPALYYSENNGKKIINGTYELTPNNLFVYINESMPINGAYSIVVDDADPNIKYTLITKEYDEKENDFVEITTLVAKTYYKMELTASFNNYEIPENNEIFKTKFTLSTTYNTAIFGKYTEGERSYNLQIEIDSDEIISKITLQDNSGLSTTYNEDTNELYIHSDGNQSGDYGITSGNRTEQFDATIKIDSDMKFYIHVVLKSYQAFGLVADTNISIVCTIGTESYEYQLSADDTQFSLGSTKDKYLGLLEVGESKSIIELSGQPSDGNTCFKVENGEKYINLKIKGQEGSSFLGIGKGTIELSIIPWSMGE